MQRKTLLAGMLLLSFGLISGCAGSGGGGTPPPPPPPPEAPSIMVQPVSQTVTAGQTATFSVVASGTLPLNYQWQKNSVAISGATSTSYTTPATTDVDNNSQFIVTVSNTAGSATSTSATLTVNPSSVAPSITVQPVSQTVTAGQTATFNVAAIGTEPLTYQWKKNGVAISVATSSSYTTPATTDADNNSQFIVTVSNTAGSATSAPAILTVTPVIVQNPIPVISSTAPCVVRTGYGSGFLLRVAGKDFVFGSVIQVNGANRPTNFVSSTELTTTVFSNEVSTSGQLAITVVSPAPGGGTSNTATVKVDITASISEVGCKVTLTDPDPTRFLGLKVKAVDGVFGDGKTAVAVTARNGAYVVSDLDSHPGNFTVSQMGSALLPGVKFVYTGSASAGTPFWNVSASGDIDKDGVNDICMHLNVATSDPVNKPFAGTVFCVQGGSALLMYLEIDLAHPPTNVKVVRMEGVGANNFAGSSMADAIDFDGDGYSDIVFGAPGYGAVSAAGFAYGGVYLIYGRPGFFGLGTIDLNQAPHAGDVLWTRNDPLDGYGGYSLGSAFSGSDTIYAGGDLSGDGIPDLAIGDPRSQNISPNAQKVYVMFGGPGSHGTFYVSDVGALYRGATYYVDNSNACHLGDPNPCYNAGFGTIVGGRTGSIMSAHPGSGGFGDTLTNGTVFISEQTLTSGQVVQVQSSVQNLQATSLWDMSQEREQMGYTMFDGDDGRLIGVPGFDNNRGKLLFIPSSGLPGGNLDASSVVTFTLIGEQQGDLFSYSLHRAKDGSILVSSRSFANDPQGGKFYYIPAGNLLF